MGREPLEWELGTRLLVHVHAEYRHHITSSIRSRSQYEADLNIRVPDKVTVQKQLIMERSRYLEGSTDVQE